MKLEDYEQQLKSIQRKLTLLQQAYLRSGAKAVVVLEGYDAAGKGSMIRRLVWALDPRSLRVHATAAPSPAEHRQHWMKRFWFNIPNDGHWAIFDRSWYGRVLVERVEGLAGDAEWRRAYEEIANFESLLTEEGTKVLKLLLEITPDTQMDRFRARYETPAKRWKLTMEDLRNRGRFDAYRDAYSEMVERTSLPDAPWIRIDANDKKAARLAGLAAIYDHLSAGVDQSIPAPSPEIDAFFASLHGK